MIEWLSTFDKVHKLCFRKFSARQRMVVFLLFASLALLMSVVFVAGYLLPRVLYLDWARPLFIWDSIPKSPKIYLLVAYALVLAIGICTMALLVRVVHASSDSLSHWLVWRRWLVSFDLRWVFGGLCVAWIPLIWALGVTPFYVPNEFLALPTETKMQGQVNETLRTMDRWRMEGLKVPLAVDQPVSHHALKLPINSGAASSMARLIAHEYPEYYWFDEASEFIEIHRIGDIEQYIKLAAMVQPAFLTQLQERFHSDLRESLSLATRKYTATEKEFLKLNKPELERGLVLGRFFYHHSFIFNPAVAWAQDVDAPRYGSQYGLGLTQAFATVISLVAEDKRFNAYLLFLYVSYPLYFFLIIGVARRFGIDASGQLLIAVVTVLSYLLSEMETVRLGVGLAPWRHWLDVVVLLALYRFGRAQALRNFLPLLISIVAAVYWSKEMGAFIGLSAVGALLALALFFRQSLAALVALVLFVVVAITWHIADPNAQTLTSFVLLGANTPAIPWGLVTGTALGICGLMAVWLLLAPKSCAQQQGLGWWCVLGGSVFYVAASAIYWVYYPRPHHLAPVLPVFALGAATGWHLAVERFSGHVVLEHLKLLPRLVLMALMACLVLLITARSYELISEQRIFMNHRIHEWNFPTARLKSTADPLLLAQSIDMIRSRNPEAVVDIISPWEVVLLPMAGKGKNGPFVLSFDSLLTDNEVELLVEHLLSKGSKTIFVDSRLMNGQYELPLLEEAYMTNRQYASVLRVRAHAMLREVFGRIQHCYKKDQSGPLISVWIRTEKTCQSRR